MSGNRGSQSRFVEDPRSSRHTGVDDPEAIQSARDAWVPQTMLRSARARKARPIERRQKRQCSAEELGFLCPRDLADGTYVLLRKQRLDLASKLAYAVVYPGSHLELIPLGLRSRARGRAVSRQFPPRMRDSRRSRAVGTRTPSRQAVIDRAGPTRACDRVRGALELERAAESVNRSHTPGSRQVE